MSGSNTPKDSDVQQGAIAADPWAAFHAALQRAGATYAAKQKSDLNQQLPVSEFDPVTKQRRPEFIPQAVPRRFDSPLKLFDCPPDPATGKPTACGPNGERFVTGTWGDKRSVKYDPPPDVGRTHQGLDFRAPVGESVLASGDGTVTFVGFQTRPQSPRYQGRRASVKHPTVDARGHVLNSSGVEVADLQDLGHGGIYVEITHNGDFHGYVTHYMHLSEASIEQGKPVTAGDVIGKVGRTGGNNGVTEGPHLHWQVLFNGKKTNPAPLVVHYKPGEPVDGDPGLGQYAAFANAVIKELPAGAATVANGAMNQLQALSRAVSAENKTSAQFKAEQAAHSQLVTKKLSMQSGAVYDSMAKFQSTIPKVSQPMVFNFATGYWGSVDKDGKFEPENPPKAV